MSDSTAYVTRFVSTSLLPRGNTCGAVSRFFKRILAPKWIQIAPQVLVGIATVVALIGPVFGQSIRCVQPAPIRSYEPDSGSAKAQRLLSEGVAYFDSGRHAVASRRIKAALSAGFNDEQESAIAHKYLGLYYCINNSKKLCELHLRRAVRFSPSLDFDNGERLHPKFASAIKKVTGQNMIACAPESVATQTALQSATVSPVEQIIEREIAVKPQPVSSSRRDPGILQLDVRPWGQVVVNNKPMGLTPPAKEFKLAPGLHNVEIRNGNLEAYRTQVEVFEGGVVRISHHF
jgi:hypothetical protein